MPDRPHMEDSLSKPLGEVLKIVQSRIMRESTYFGIHCKRSPMDFWVYQEMIFALKPDIIVEIGTLCGGNALAMAHLCDNMNRGRIIAVDINHSRVGKAALAHPRISFVLGDACKMFYDVARRCHGAKTILIIEDSSHTYQGTLDVLSKYSKLVTVGSYLIVEDSICHYGLDEGPSPGPYEAITNFLAATPNFHSDRTKESFLITWNPKGYLKRVS